MNVQKVKLQLKKLAEDFDLRYDSTWFEYLWVSVRNNILIEYIGGCQDPIYQKYGTKTEKRIKNIEKFVNSKDFNDCLRRYGGQVVRKNDLKQQGKIILKIKDDILRDELLILNKRIKNNFSKADILALLTIPRNKMEKDWQMKFCLRHEWIHILLEKNKIKFQKLDKEYWVYDEGLDEFMGAYLDGSLEKLENFRDKEKYPVEKKYWVYAIKFRELLGAVKMARGRKKVLLNFISNLTRVITKLV